MALELIVSKVGRGQR